MKRRTPVPESSIDRLREISTWISSVLDLDELLELIIEKATRMMEAKASSLLVACCYWTKRPGSSISRWPRARKGKKSDNTILT